MSKDSFPRTPEVSLSPELREQVQLAVEHSIQQGEYLNEGNNGLLVESSIVELPPDVLDQRFPREDRERLAAIKLLKIYSPGSGRKEFEAQQYAYDLAHHTGASVARVPAPILFFELKNMSEETQEALRRHGLNISSNAEVLIMEKIEGVDLITKAYWAVLISAGYEKYNPGADISKMKFDELEREVSLIVGFETLKNPARSENERIGQERRLWSMNVKKLFNYLKKINYKLNPSVFARLDKTVKLFHEHGLAHNDLHERNIMITDAEGDQDVYVIDYGSALLDGDVGHTYHSGKKPMEDTETIARWRNFSLNRSEEEEKEKQLFTDAIQKNLERALAGPFGKMAKDLEKLDEVSAAKAIGSELLLQSAIGQQKFEMACAIILKHVKNRPDHKGAISEVLDRLITGKKLSPYAHNYLLKIRELL